MGVRDMCRRKTEDGELRGKLRKIGINGRYQGAMGGILLPSSSVSFRGRSRTPATCVDGRRKTEAGNYEEKQMEIGIIGRNKGGVGGILLPPDFVSFRGRLVWAEMGKVVDTKS